MKCVNCGFLGYRPGGYDKLNNPYLEGTFRQCHTDMRQNLESGKSYVHYSEDGESWEVIGCFHRVWVLWGYNQKKDIEKAKALLNESRRCPFYYPYRSGYEPVAHNELRRDKKNQRVMLIVGIINATAVLVAVIVTALLRG